MRIVAFGVACAETAKLFRAAPHGGVPLKLDRMIGMRELGRVMVVTGGAIAALGALLWLAGRPGGLPLRLGRLPGDIAYQGKSGSFYFPVVTCILLSVALTLILWLVQWLKR